MRYFAIRFGVVLVAAAIAIAPITATAQQTRTYGPDTWNGGWWMFGGPMIMILFFGAIIVLIVLLVRWLEGSGRGTTAPPSHKAPLDILKERYASGEIDKEEFEERRRVLTE